MKDLFYYTVFHGASTKAVIWLKKTGKGNTGRGRERKRKHRQGGERKEMKGEEEISSRRMETWKRIERKKKREGEPSSFRKEHYFPLFECIKVRLF